jgi:Arylsulfotransferase (ASST)
LRKALLGGSVLVVLSSATTLAFASRRIVAEQAAFRGPVAARCVPSTLNRSAVLPGTSVAVSPLPGSYDASPRTQISLLGAAPVQAPGGVRVSGSQTGSHRGRLIGYSQGDGASFVPSSPFRPGETVTVRGNVTVGSATQPFSYQFVIAQQDTLAYTPPARQAPAGVGEVQRFHSRRELEPPAITVTARSPQAAPGYVFAAPYSGRGQHGLMIFDEAGSLVWFDPLPAGTEAANLEVQQYGGRPVLTWWQGYISPQGFGEGQAVIADGSYHVIGRVYAGNGYKVDLHDLRFTSQSTVLITVFDPIHCNLSVVGGSPGGAITDSIVQEIDLNTGLVRSEWHSLDHVGLGDSYSSPVNTNTSRPFDFFHVNSIDQLPDGTTLISARNTWTLYELNTHTGQVLTRIGGRHTDVKLLSGSATAFQHDATMLPNGTISIFDNGAVPKVHPQSRGIVVAIDPQAKTDNVVSLYEHPPALSAGSQGNLQLLANGDAFVGWGSAPYFSEFSAGGQLLFDARMHGSYQSYRAYRFPWTGAPPDSPAIALAPAIKGRPAGGPVTVYASWNGDTRTASWRVLAGLSAQQLSPVAAVARQGFETAIATPGPERFLAVQALDASGAVLAVSHTIRG